MRNRALLAAAVLIVVALGGCGPSPTQVAASLTGGDVDRGAADIPRYGCGSCHTIPGIPGAHGLVGPSLAGIRNRTYTASQSNSPAALERWIEDPHAMNPKTAMPNLGVTPRDAVDITAYLYSLK